MVVDDVFILSSCSRIHRSMGIRRYSWQQSLHHRECCYTPAHSLLLLLYSIIYSITAVVESLFAAVLGSRLFAVVCLLLIIITMKLLTSGVGQATAGGQTGSLRRAQYNESRVVCHECEKDGTKSRLDDFLISYYGPPTTPSRLNFTQGRLSSTCTNHSLVATCKEFDMHPINSSYILCKEILKDLWLLLPVVLPVPFGASLMVPLLDHPTE